MIPSCENVGARAVNVGLQGVPVTNMRINVPHCANASTVRTQSTPKTTSKNLLKFMKRKKPAVRVPISGVGRIRMIIL